MAFAFYASKLVVSYLVGTLILERLAPKASHRFWPLLLGIVLYTLVRSIPILGLVVGLVVTFLGLGAAWLAYARGRARAEELEEGATEEAASSPA